jgi:hypothetical protein
MNEDCELAYLAGFFDGEGCISCSPTNENGLANFQLNVLVSQNDGRALEPFARRWGGKIGKRNRPASADDTSLWAIGGTRAIQCIRDLLPYLRAKRDEADVAMHWPMAAKRGRGYVTPASIITKRREIYEALREIKQSRKVAITSTSQPGLVKMQDEGGLLGRPDVIEAIRLYQTGMSRDEVADELGVNPATVGYWIKSAGVSRRRGPRPGHYAGGPKRRVAP